MTKAREFRDFVERTLIEEGVGRPYEFSIAHNAHQQVVFYVKGVRVKYQFPFSPSDHRAMLNSRSSVRKAIRAASGYALSGGPTQRSLLHDGGVLPREPHDVGAGRAGVSKLAPSVSDRWSSCPGQALKARSRA